MNQLQKLISNDKPNQQLLLGNNWIVEKIMTYSLSIKRKSH